MIERFCACGCGHLTESWLYNDKRRGQVKGEAKPYYGTHSKRRPPEKRKLSLTTAGYYVTRPYEHPWQRPGGGALAEHIRVAELAMGKRLPRGCVVHHINEIRTDNRPQNLVVCSRAYHGLLHQRMRAKAATGNADARTCNFCHCWDTMGNLRRAGQVIYHTECRKTYRQQRERAA